MPLPSIPLSQKPFRRFSLSLLLPLLLLSHPAAAFEAGTTWIRITPPHRSEPERVLITYPAKTDGEPFSLGAGELWTGAPARRDATPVNERFPIVILSHGSGGNAASLGWLSTELAKNGFIVAAPNHIHSTSGDSIPVESFKIWERPQDISALIDTLLADPQWSKRVDPDRIGGIGFSLGGTSMMLTAGAQVSLGVFSDYCAASDGKDGGCNWFQRGGVDFAKVDRKAFEGIYKDRRLSALVAVDPGLAMAYQPESLKAVDMPALFVNLGEGDAIMPGVRAEKLTDGIGGARYATIPGAVHFTFLSVCNQNGAEVLKRYGEDEPICEDGGDVSRDELHKQIFFKIAVFLRKSLVEK